MKAFRSVKAAVNISTTQIERIPPSSKIGCLERIFSLNQSAKWWFALPTSAFICLISAPAAKAGTAAYYATCHFIDQGGDNGGSVLEMPCYAVEGGNAYGAFFHIRWKDGVQTRMNANPSEPLTDTTTGRLYERLDRNIFSASSDGDVIVLENPKYTNDRYGVDDPSLIDLL